MLSVVHSVPFQQIFSAKNKNRNGSSVLLLLRYYWDFSTYVFSSFAKVFFFFPNEVVSVVFSIAVIQCNQEQLKVQGVHYGRKPS